MVAAQGSEQKASASEINAKSSEQASKLSETNAKKSEESAASSAATATGQASSARTSASNASVSEANAKASEKAVSVSASNAKASADTASTQASASASSATSAKNSATSASQSASSASSSASSASNSASSAASSAASASDSKDKASEYKTSASGSATAAASSASSASTSATNAKAAMNTANTAASSASTSAINASTSASNASKSEVAAKSAQAEAERARDEANSALAKMSGALKYMGQVDNYNDLPSTGNSKGDTWNVVNADPSHHIKAGDNVAWNGTEWDDLSGVVDLSAYAEKADYQKAITSATANGATITFNHKDGTTSTATVNNVASSTSATNDAKGQKIDTTYEKISDASNVHASLQDSINTKQDKLTFDTAPTNSSSNPVTSGGIKTALDTKLDKTGTAVSATKLQTARTLSLTGKAAGSTTFDGSSNASINVTSVNADTASKLSTARKINITGNATGSTSFDGTSDVSINVNVNESEHAAAADSATTADNADKLTSESGSNYLTIDTDENSWSVIGSNPGIWLKSIRTETDAPPYSLGYFSAAIAFGGGDTKGIITHAFDTPNVKFAGGNDSTAGWKFSIYGGFNNEVYDLNDFPTKTGGGASGTWGINITGNAANDGNGANIANTYLKLDSFKSSLIASLPACYERSTMWSAAKNVITVPDYITVNIGNNGYVKTGASTIDVNTASNWDDSTYATSANRAGKDFYIYACQASGTAPKFVLSANSTVPSGYTATNSRKIGGFHCECADVGTIDGHPLSGYIAGDILPASVWDLRHRPISSPEGMVFDGRRWIDIYLASWDGSKLVSAYNGVICDGGSSPNFHCELFTERFAEIGKHLPSREDFIHFAKGIEEGVNISGSKDYNTTGGHVTTSGRRMISNYGIEDPAGYMFQWGSDLLESMSSSHSGDNLYMDGYDWSDLSVYNSDVDSTKRGSCSGFLRHVIFGGLWDDGVNCGSRSTDCGSFSSQSYVGIGARGASEPWVG